MVNEVPEQARLQMEKEADALETPARLQTTFSLLDVAERSGGV